MTDDRLERPSWAHAAHGPLGFTHRAFSGPGAVSNQTQVHGRDVHVLRPTWKPGDPLPAGPVSGDAIWTDVPGLPIAVRVADCTPILLWDPGVGAVAAVHAGWRGTAADIAGAAVEVGVRALSVEPDRLFAAIGPCIGLCCFEVGDEVVEGLRATGLSDETIGVTRGARGRDHVNLRATNRALLERAGVRPERIEDVGGCSACAPGPRYESYRRDGKASGRMRGIIAPLLTVLFLFGCPSPTPPGPGPSADDAQRLLGEGDPVAAENTLRAALNGTPDDAHLRAVLARALHAQGRYDEAAVQGRIALGIDPTFWEVAYNLACHHARLGQVEEALHWLQAALPPSGLSPEDVAQDEDFAGLADDHRFAFYLATGVLTRLQEDAVIRVVPDRVKVGSPATLTLLAITLNQELMARREAMEVELTGPLPPGALAPVTRRETFSSGDEGGREYMQRSLHFGLRPLKPGRLSLGPFRVRLGDRELTTNAVVLDVLPGEPHPAVAALTPPLRPGMDGPDPIAAFFRAPSTADEVLLSGLAETGAPAVEFDSAREAPVPGAWAVLGDRAVRAYRFRALDIGELPDAVPPRPSEAQRSVFVQRGTEGWSHIVDVRPR